MHQYTADLANRLLAAGDEAFAGPNEACTEPNEVSLVTTTRVPRDRYAPDIRIHTPVATRDRGFSFDGIVRSLPGIRRTLAAIRQVGPDVVHFTGPHLWNPLLLVGLRRAGVPAVHTIHDLHPHAGSVYGRLLYPWNAWVRRAAGHLLVHGECTRQELLSGRERGRGGEGVTCTLLTHLFVGYAQEEALRRSLAEVQYEPWALFIGRLLPYKGLDTLVEAARQLPSSVFGAVVAGEGRLADLVPGEVPANVEVRDRLVEDDEAVDLFRRCGLLVLPYREASQSALVAAAYFFRKPVIVTDVGALPDYVRVGETGWVIPAEDPGALAEVLREALGDPKRLAAMGMAGRSWYEEARLAEGAALREMYARMAGR
jgi:glycosyltransferase involved in cell wall biosynthesis